MSQFKRNFWILGIGVVLTSSSFTMIVPFLSVFLYELGADEKWIDLWAGLIYASFYLVGALMGPVWGMLADKYGRKKMAVRAGLCLSAIYCLIAVVRNPWELLVVRLLHGAVGGFVPAAMAIVASSSPDKKMGYHLGLMQSAFAAGQVMGPLFGGMLFEWVGMRVSALIPAAALFVAALAVVFWVKEENPKEEKTRAENMNAEGSKAETKEAATKEAETKDAKLKETESKETKSEEAKSEEAKSKETKSAAGPEAGAGQERSAQGFFAALRHPVLLRMLLLLLVFQCAFHMLQPLLPLYLAKLHGKLEGAVLSSGFVISLVGFATVIAAPRWGIAGRRYGYSRMLMLCFIAAGALGIGLHFPNTILSFGILYFVFGLFVAGILPSINTIAAQNADKAFQGRLFGMTKSASHLGAMTGGYSGGIIASWLGIANVFLICGGLLLLTGLFARIGRGTGNKTKRLEGSA